MKKIKIEHKPLHCPICGERFMTVLGKPLPNHAQMRCMTQNGDEMDLGICENCLQDGVTLEMVNGILEGIKDYWVFEIEADKNLKKEEKETRKKIHLSHNIVSLSRMVRTGKEAEKEAKKKGLLK